MKVSPRILTYNLYRALEHGDTKENVKDLMEIAYQYLYEEGMLSDEEPKQGN